MKSVKYLSILSGVLIALLYFSCSKSKDTNAKPVLDPPNSPPKLWQEHWFEHNSLLHRVYFDTNLALYFDEHMDSTVTWPRKTFSDAWAYIKKNYGPYGDSTRLYVIMHGSLYSGEGHPSPYYDPTHDYRNAIDQGMTDWTYPTGDNIRIPIHEIGHIVASSSYGVTHDISSSQWGDSKFAEIFIYDVCANIGRQDEADRVYDQMQFQTDTFPKAGTQWFKDWFYPIYAKYGKGAVLARYFKEISDNAHERSEGLNMGEFVHFFSGAAGVNLKDQATIAFGWTDEWDAELKQAQKDYPGVKYNY